MTPPPAILPPSHILFEDNHIIIINKKPSQIVQGDKTGDQPLSDIVKEYLKTKYNKQGEVFLGVVHRLDRPVSGAVIFAKTGKALTRLNQMLHDREIHKMYWAVVKQRPQPEEGHLVHFLIKNEKKNISLAHQQEKEGSHKAELTYKLLASSDRFNLLEIALLTGRHHQIRAQLAAIGCPVKGDVKYGFPRANRDASIHLHARTIEFIHPVKKETVKVTAPPPDDPLWNSFG